ncbi:hypothetical protein BST61_g2186 [Cercospora zeina]
MERRYAETEYAPSFSTCLLWTQDTGLSSFHIPNEPEVNPSKSHSRSRANHPATARRSLCRCGCSQSASPCLRQK